MKLEFTISERDKRLLMILFSVLVIAAAYYFGYNNIVAETQKYDTEISTLRSKKTDLNSKVSNKDKYEAQTAQYMQEFQATLLSYANGTTQPSSFDFLNQVEGMTGTWIKSVSFAAPTAIYTFGSKMSSNPANSSVKAYSTDMVGYKTSMTLSYEAQYGQWKDLIAYINNYNSKNTIETITMSYNEANNMVSGTMLVSLYSITGSERKYTEPEFSTVPIGTENIFNAE